MEKEQQLKNAIALVKETESSFFKENRQSYYLTFSNDGNRMWIEPFNSNNLTIALSQPIFGLDNSKKYVLERLKEELTELK